MIFVGTQEPGNTPEVSGAIETLNQYGFDQRHTIGAVEILGRHWATRMAHLDGSNPIRVMGISIDFDAFCGPIIDTLGRSGRTVSTHCLWITDVPGVERSDVDSLIAREHRYRQSVACDTLLVATAVMTEMRHLELIVDRAAELYPVSEIHILAAVSSDKVMSMNRAGLKIESLVHLPKHSSKFNPNTFGLYNQRLPTANVRPNFMPKRIQDAAFSGLGYRI